MLKRFTRYVTQSVAGMIGISVYVLADTFFISVSLSRLFLREILFESIDFLEIC